jgi:hypothetical protein
MTTNVNGINDKEHKTAGNGLDPAVATSDDVEDLARTLLLPSPAGLAAKGQLLVIPIVKKPAPLEFFRCHPEYRFTMRMVSPRADEINAAPYAVTPAAEILLARHHFEPFIATLYPICLDTTPVTYKLVYVKPPADGGKWDAWNLSKKLALELAVDKWIALRSVKSAYQACDPDPAAEFPEVVWPEWSDNEWLHKSLVVADLVIHDEKHPIFKDIKRLR